MKLRDITLDDVADLLDMEGSRFDILVATASRAKEIHERENREPTPPPPPPPPPFKIKIKRSSSARTSGASAKHTVDEIENQEKTPSPPPPPPASPSSTKVKRPTSAAAKKGKQLSSPKKRKTEQLLHQLPPRLPEEFKKAIADMARGKNLTAPRLVIQKVLTPTDLNSGQCRLSMPKSQLMIDDFLTEEEKRYIRRHEGIKKKYVEAWLVEPSTATAKVKITQWDMPKGNGAKTSSSYVINGTWKEIMKRNKLVVDMPVQVWSFRVDRELCFALVC